MVLCVGLQAQEPPASNPNKAVEAAAQAARQEAQKTAAGDQIIAPPPMPLPSSLAHGDWEIRALHQSKDGSIHKLEGDAQVESNAVLVKADYIEYNEETGDVVARGHVYYHSFLKNEQLWCDHLEYNNDDQRGKFWDVKGETVARTVVRKGILSGSSPYHWEGEWAERIDDKYYLYNGWVTNCKMPNPWWKMKGPKFVIEYEKSAKAYHSWFILRRMPIFYAPYFYHSLQKEPRHSGFLIPNFVPHSQRGVMVGLGYFWAINRSYDLTYRLQDYNTSAFANHFDFRGKPRAGSDFDLIVYDVKDRGASGSTGPLSQYSGLNIAFLGRADLGNGWNAVGQVNYVSSFRFIQEWAQSVNEVIGSEIHAVGSATKNWNTYTLDVVMSRLENFQQAEFVEASAPPGSTKLTSDAVLIHKLPEVDFASRDRQVFKDIPLWFSWNSSAGLYYRSEPVFDCVTSSGALSTVACPDNVPVNNFVANFQTSQFMPRVDFSPHATSAFHLGDFSFIPSVGLDETFYGQSQSSTGTVVNGDELYRVLGTDLVRSARDFSLDVIFPSFGRVFDKKTIFGDKLKHVIEPRATYKYVTGVGDDFNRFIRFDQTDLLANTNEVTLSLTNRIYAKRGDTVTEIFTWEVAQKRYFDPTFGGAIVAGQPNLFMATADLTAYSFLLGPRTYSPVSSLLRTSPIAGVSTLSFNWQADYDPKYHRMVNSYLSVDYHYKKYAVSVGNNSVHADPLLTASANQYHGHIQYGDAQHRGWNAGVDINYDYRLGRLAYATAQVTYNTDCCGFSVQLRRINYGIRDETVPTFSFAIANLGTFGSLKKNDRMF
jgi:LPS-assembly protein